MESLSSEYNAVRSAEPDEEFSNLTASNQSKAYVYAVLFTLFSCIYIILIKLAPSYHIFNHALIRYLIQLLIMTFLISSKNSEFFGPKERRPLLFARGLFGAGTIIFGLLSFNYLSPSDVEALSNSSIFMTAILGKILLNEKITIAHAFSLLLTILGVLFILRPPLLISIESKIFCHLSASNTTLHSCLSSDIQTSLLGSIPVAIGVLLILISSLFQSLIHITTRKLVLDKIGVLVVSIYPAYIGLPISITASMVVFYLGTSKIRFLPYELAFMCIGSVLSTISIYFLILSLKYMQASRFAVIKASGVFFMFLFQYLFLGVGMNLVGIIGAIFIVVGTLIITMEKKCLRYTESD